MRTPTLILKALVVQGNSRWGSWGIDILKGLEEVMAGLCGSRRGKGVVWGVGGEGSIAKS